MRRLLAAAPLLLMGLLACGANPPAADAGPGALGPALTVERFLQAANAVAQLSDPGASNPSKMASELETMARLFGTEDGSVLGRHPRDEVEQRMFILSRLLRHTDYRLGGERAVPGESGSAVEVMVQLQKAGRGEYTSVPFVVVRSDGDWLVTRIDVERLTGG